MTSRVLLGFGGNVDVEIVWNEHVLARLATEYEIRQEELDTSVRVVDERSLVVSILAFLASDQGGERYVADARVLTDFPENFEHRWTLGGSGIRAAMVLDRFDLSSQVHLVSTNPTVRRLLPATVTSINEVTEDSVHPHLIVQYPAGCTISTGLLTVGSGRHNRLIYVNDPPNERLELTPELESHGADLDLVLVSGLNSMQDPQLLEDRIQRIEGLLEAMPEHGLVIFEDAGQHVPELGARVQQVMAQRADIFSMNEDELALHCGQAVDILDADAVAAALRHVREHLGIANLLVHTQYWAAVHGPSAVHLRQALRFGTLAGAVRYMYGDGATRADYSSVAAHCLHPQGKALVEDLQKRFDSALAGVPAYDLNPPEPTTIGLGDTFLGGFIAELASRDTESLFWRWGARGEVSALKESCL